MAVLLACCVTASCGTSGSYRGFPVETTGDPELRPQPPQAPPATSTSAAYVPVATAPAVGAVIESGDVNPVDVVGIENPGAPGAQMPPNVAEAAGGASGEASDPVGAEPAPPVQTDTLVGWASVAGLDLETTTGGLGGATVIATTADELVDLAAREEPLIIQITGTLRAPSVQVASNKTLIGVGAGATLEGALRIRGRATELVSNVIVQNLHVNAAFSELDDGDGVQIYFAHHVWVDHCEVRDAAGGNLDVVHGSDFVTVSWSKFLYTDVAPEPEHRFSNLVGHSDSEAAVEEDTGHLRVTFHHDWWGDLVTERMPWVRFGDVHVFNNYYSSVGNNYTIRAGRDSRVLVESNYFDGVEKPHETNNDEDGEAQILAVGNVYEATTGAQNSTGSAFVPSYEYTPDPAEGLPELVTLQAGPR